MNKVLICKIVQALTFMSPRTKIQLRLTQNLFTIVVLLCTPVYCVLYFNLDLKCYL
jgi:hypothetical protein